VKMTFEQNSKRTLIIKGSINYKITTLAYYLVSIQNEIKSQSMTFIFLLTNIAL